MTYTIDIHHHEDHSARQLLADARAGLTATPKWMPPKWFYDEVGSELFEQITRLPEYYPTRREAEILGRDSKDIAGLARASTLVELGSGTSEKTRLLLDALDAADHLDRFVGFDVSEATLRTAGQILAERYPDAEVHMIVGDFDHHLAEIPVVPERLVVFLGGTIGNLTPEERARFLSEVADNLRSGEHFLVGTDLVKPAARLVAAYDDRAGVTARFNLNLLQVMNNELDADFDLDLFEHRARWNPSEERIEMWLVARQAHSVTVPGLGLGDDRVGFEAGEEMLTELSYKFHPEGVSAELADAGFDTVGRWTDEAGDFALTMGRRR